MKNSKSLKYGHTSEEKWSLVEINSISLADWDFGEFDHEHVCWEERRIKQDDYQTEVWSKSDWTEMQNETFVQHLISVKKKEHLA